MPLRMHHARIGAARFVRARCSAPSRDGGSDVRDAITLMAVRVARARCEDACGILRAELRHKGIEEPDGIDDVCEKFLDIESQVSGEMGASMQRDSSGDDPRLQSKIQASDPDA